MKKGVVYLLSEEDIKEILTVFASFLLSYEGTGRKPEDITEELPGEILDFLKENSTTDY